jgi:integrase
MHVKKNTLNESKGLVLSFDRRWIVVPANEESISYLVRKISARAGTQLSNHKLRRTWGRTLWLAGVKMETILEMMGHEDIKTTIPYLGIKADDQNAAVQKLIAFRENLNC